jgi:uncharacterized protein
LSTPIIVFAKAPVAGEAKTRLISELGAEGAAALHRALVRRTVATALAAEVGPVELCCSPDATHPFFGTLGVTLTQQDEGDLGARMHRALERQAPALLIGSDCPALTPSHLREAAAALATHDAVLAPAEDGGYVLVGVRRSAELLFAGIPWGSDAVFGATRERLATLHWRWHELAPLWDLDRPVDLERARRAGWLLIDSAAP